MVVDVQLACDDAGVPGKAKIQDWVRYAASATNRAPAADSEIAVRIVDAAEIQTLNRLYRDKDAPTNVLSFPVGDMQGLPAEAGQQLGDVVVCAAVIGAEAEAQGKAVDDHWAHMLVHGVLHLLGYDHENDADAAEMEDLEVAILAGRGISNPYASP